MSGFEKRMRRKAKREFAKKLQREREPGQKRLPLRRVIQAVETALDARDQMAALARQQAAAQQAPTPTEEKPTDGPSDSAADSNVPVPVPENDGHVDDGG